MTSLHHSCLVAAVTAREKNQYVFLLNIVCFNSEKNQSNMYFYEIVYVSTVEKNQSNVFLKYNKSIGNTMAGT